jgi:hypothetical protein
MTFAFYFLVSFDTLKGMRIFRVLFIIFGLIVFGTSIFSTHVYGESGSCTCDQPKSQQSNLNIPQCAITSNSCNQGYQAICKGNAYQVTCNTAGCTCVQTTPTPTFNMKYYVCGCKNNNVTTASCNPLIPVCTSSDTCECQMSNPGANCANPGELCNIKTSRFCCQGNCSSTTGQGNCQGTSVTSSKACDIISDESQKNDCISCFGGLGKYSSQGSGAWTAIGCIQTDPSKFFSTLLTFGISIAGGIAFLLILLGGFQILTSSGNPEQLNAGKELVGSAITGLLLIIFSVFFLKIIGVDILGIPGWGPL